MSVSHIETNPAKVTRSKQAAIVGVLHLRLHECSLSVNIITLCHYLLIFIFLFFRMMSSGNTCAVFNCANSGVKNETWQKEGCEIH